jgi:hypothetical protein
MAHKESITFQDLDGKEVTQDWYFSLTEAAMAELPFMHDEDRETKLTEIAKNRDSRAWIDILKMVIFASVGRREGDLLVKNQETLDQFRYGGAYDEFFANLLEQQDAGFGFFQSTLPDRLRKKLDEGMAQQARTYNEEEMSAMTDDEFFTTFGTDDKKYSPEVLMQAYRRKNAAA